MELKDGYFVPYKAVATGSTDAITATLVTKNMDLNKIKFDQDNSTMEATIKGESIMLKASAKTKGDNPPIIARMVDDKTKAETIVGKLGVVGYNQENLKLHIVPVNGTTVPTNATEIEKQLNGIYNPAVINWKVSTDPSLEVGGLASPFDNGSSGVLSTYTGDMKTVINTYIANTKLEDDNYYLFLVPKGTNMTEDGYMPRSKQCGFIFMDAEENDPAKVVRTIAHELGHGAFTLQHTFSDYPALAQGSTDNLMDYGSGTTLLKYQWDVIHNPRIVLGVFENDDAGASVTTPTGLTALVNSDTLKADKILIITGNSFKLNARRNVTNGGEVSFRLTIKPEGGGADILYPSNDWKKVQNNESWVLELSSVQEGKYSLSFKAGETTNTIDFYVRAAAYDYACNVCGRNLKLTQDNLNAIFPSSKIIKDDPEALTYFNEALEKGGFNTCHRQAHFFSQVYEESGGMNASEEGSNYSAQWMLEIFKGNTNTKTVFFKQNFWDSKDYLNYASIGLYETSTDTTITKHEGKVFRTFKWRSSSTADTVRLPTSFFQKKSAEYKKLNLTKAEQKTRGENLLNLVYANLNGNGDVASKDGYKFRGRGAIQLTGRITYREVSNKCNTVFGTTFDLEGNPDVLKDDTKAIIYSVAGFFSWKFNDLKSLDTKDINFVTRKVNGGLNGISNRTTRFNEYINGRLNNCKIKK